MTFPVSSSAIARWLEIWPGKRGFQNVSRDSGDACWRISLMSVFPETEPTKYKRLARPSRVPRRQNDRALICPQDRLRPGPTQHRSRTWYYLEKETSSD